MRSIISQLYIKINIRKERISILADNQELHNTVRNLEYEYTEKKKTLESEFKDKSFDLEYEYKHKIHKLEKENNHLHKIIDKFYKTIDKFIKWICTKFNFGDSKELVKEFENETRTLIDPVKQIKKEEREKELEY